MCVMHGSAMLVGCSASVYAADPFVPFVVVIPLSKGGA